MAILDVFALIILMILGVALLTAVGILGAMPGWIARRRQHPQADAIAAGAMSPVGT
jgi:Protein of unknown function (DUF3302)